MFCRVISCAVRFCWVVVGDLLVVFCVRLPLVVYLFAGWLVAACGCLL